MGGIHPDGPILHVRVYSPLCVGLALVSQFYFDWEFSLTGGSEALTVEGWPWFSAFSALVLQ